VLVGAERFLAERAVGLLRAATLGDSPPGFNDDVFQGPSLSARTLSQSARTVPMFAKSRFILVRDVDAAKDAELEALAAYFDSPPETTCVVMLSDKLDARTRFAKAAKSSGAWVDVQPLRGAAARQFAVGEARARGHALDSAAADGLLDATGTDLATIDDALERLSLYVGAGKAIDTGAVSACIAKVRVESIWSLVDAVGMRDRRTVLRTASSLLSDREPPLRILAMVARQLRMVAKMRDALASGLKPIDAAKVAGAPPFKAQDLATSAKRFSPAQIATAFRTLSEADRALKSSTRTPEIVLEEALLRL
jgi:DNA polymerase III subunit delta